jgi:TolB-like protein
VPDQTPVQRRLAAILAGDVAGYSRLMGVDEVGTLNNLKAIRRELADPAIAAHHGRVVKTTGDGILIEFPSVVDAVACAVAIQEGMVARNADVPEDKRIVFRIGINIGDIIIDEADILGDGVNIAARLEALAEPGGICISDDGYRQVRGKIDLHFRDLGEQRLKNIAEPIRVYAVSPLVARSTNSPRAQRSPVPRLSIVVLPFTNLGDKEQDYFADGITESLTTDLSRISGAFVIARNTAFTYKGKAADARQIGRELGVRYVMEGSVQTAGSRVRVNAQLIDTETGTHLWAERFDKPRADLFDMQDEITTRLARTIGVELVAAESRRAERERPDQMDAVDLTMHGWEIINQPISMEGMRQGRKYFLAAVQLDDQNVDALVGLAFTSHYLETQTYTSPTLSEHSRAADAAIIKALRLAPNNALAHCVRAMVLPRFLGETEQAMRECELAINLDRNLASAHALAGVLKVFLGRPEDTKAHVTEAMRLSPRDPELGRWFFYLGLSKLYGGRVHEAIDPLRKSVQLNPDYQVAQFFLASALALEGHDAEAAAVRDTGLRLDPTFTITGFRAKPRSDNATYLAQRERIYTGMRKAGVPE